MLKKKKKVRKENNAKHSCVCTGKREGEKSTTRTHGFEAWRKLLYSTLNQSALISQVKDEKQNHGFFFCNDHDFVFSAYN